MKFDPKNIRIGVVGLGYVGLPLAVEFGKFYPTVGFDINHARVAELNGGSDSTLEVSSDELQEARLATYTTDVDALRDCNFYVVTVPTPIGDGKRPLLTPLRLASETLSRVLKKGDIVVYESTVYPGATEEFCVPYLEEGSGLKLNEDFFVGYSPERINPGDKEHRLPTILKVTSGSTPETADFVDELYRTIITAGTHKASSIKVAEAAKVIENTQRDVNIALINELAMIFERMDIDTEEVLIAAGHQVELPAVPARPGGRPLHRRRSLLPDLQGRAGRLPPADDPCRPAHQRQYGPVRRNAADQEHDRRGHQPENGPGTGARAHVQGKLPGSQEYAGRRYRRGTGKLRVDGGRARPLGEPATKRRQNTASSWSPSPRPAPTTPFSSRWAIGNSLHWGRRASGALASRNRSFTISSTSCRRARQTIACNGFGEAS